MSALSKELNMSSRGITVLDIRMLVDASAALGSVGRVGLHGVLWVRAGKVEGGRTETQTDTETESEIATDSSFPPPKETSCRGRDRNQNEHRDQNYI